MHAIVAGRSDSGLFSMSVARGVTGDVSQLDRWVLLGVGLNGVWWLVSPGCLTFTRCLCMLALAALPAVRLNIKSRLG